MADRDTYDYIMRRLELFRTERSSFDSHWKEISKFYQPRKGRFSSSDRNRGDKRWQDIVNSHATWAAKVCTAGMLNGTMNPAQPWFNLEVPDPDLMEFAPVKIWLARVEQLIRAILNQSNFYQQAPVLLKELILFGTGCMTHVDDFADVARFYTHTIGSYYVGQDSRYEVNTIFREYERTIEQLVRKYGEKNVSDYVKKQYDDGNYDKWVPCIEVIEPNIDKDDESPFIKDAPFRHIVVEKHLEHRTGSGGPFTKKYLYRGGFHEFPAYVPRWDTTGEDIYATDCPGMTALGDTKGLQVQEKRKQMGIDKMVNPPLQGPAHFRNIDVSSLPGAVNVADQLNSGKLESVYDVQLRLGELVTDMEQVKRRIDQAFYVDLFLAISNMEGIQPRNQLDLTQRNEERLLQLGPVLQRVHGEFLAKLIDRIFNQGVRTGIIRNAPPELEGRELDVRFISSLAQAQRQSATAQIERIAAFVAGVAQVNPEVIDKFDWDQSVDEFSDAIGGPPRLIVPDEVVAQRRQERAKQQQAQQAIEMANQAGQAVKGFSDSLTAFDQTGGK